MLAVALSLSLSACGNKKQAAAEEGPVAVRVNGQAIMAAEFGAIAALPGAGQLPPVSASDMKTMIDLELLRQAAVESKLDQDEAVRAQLAKSPGGSPRKALAFAYINKQMSSIPAPTDADVSGYYKANPAQFAQHRLYELEECVIKPATGTEAKIKAQLGKSKKFDAFERWLKASKIKHGCISVSVDSAKATEGLLQKLGTVSVGDSVVEDGKGQMTLTFVQAMHDDPLTLDQAKPQIVKVLMDNRKKEGYANMIKQLRDKAKIEYVAPYTEQGLRLSLQK